MPLTRLTLSPAEAADFVRFWSTCYEYPRGALYDDNVGQPLTEDRVWDLYEWKNGTPIAEKKKESIRRVYLPELTRLPDLRDVEAGREYINALRAGTTGAIWDIFWLHCIAPDVFPIFDQHTYRALRQIRDGVHAEISTNRRTAINSYFYDYLPFLLQFVPNDSRAVDRALFAYGRFLATKPGRVLFGHAP